MGNNDLLNLGFFIVLAIVCVYALIRKRRIEEKEKNESILKEKQFIEIKNIEIENKLRKADDLSIKLTEIKEIDIIDVSDFKDLIIVNEKNILDKGGDIQLFSFMKIDTFLRDYRGRIVTDKSELDDILNIESLKSRIKSEGERRDLDKVIENLDDISAKLEGRRVKGFDANVDKLFELGEVIKPALEKQIKTLEYYKNRRQE